MALPDRALSASPEAFNFTDVADFWRHPEQACLVREIRLCRHAGGREPATRGRGTTNRIGQPRWLLYRPFARPLLPRTQKIMLIGGDLVEVSTERPRPVLRTRPLPAGRTVPGRRTSGGPSQSGARFARARATQKGSSANPDGEVMIPCLLTAAFDRYARACLRLRLQCLARSR